MPDRLADANTNNVNQANFESFANLLMQNQWVRFVQVRSHSARLMYAWIDSGCCRALECPRQDCRRGHFALPDGYFAEFARRRPLSTLQFSRLHPHRQPLAPVSKL